MVCSFFGQREEQRERERETDRFWEQRRETQKASLIHSKFNRSTRDKGVSGRGIPPRFTQEAVTAGLVRSATDETVCSGGSMNQRPVEKPETGSVGRR